MSMSWTCNQRSTVLAASIALSTHSAPSKLISHLRKAFGLEVIIHLEQLDFVRACLSLMSLH